MTGNSIKASVVIRVKNEGESIGGVLDAVLEQEFDGEFEIIVIDSGSTDNTIAEASKRDCAILKIPPEKFSWGYSLNLGADNSNGDFVVYLSGHCFPANHQWLKNLTSAFSDEKIAAVYGRQAPNPDAQDILEGIELVYLWFPDDKAKLKEPGFSNASCAIRKSALKQFRFDENLLSLEDGEWAERIKAAGYKIEYSPESVVYHSHKLNPDFIYRRWFLRAFCAAQTGAKIRDGQTLYLFYKSFKFIILDIKYLILIKKPLLLLQIPFYEIIRQTAAYNGARSGKMGGKFQKIASVPIPIYVRFAGFFLK